MKIEMPLCNEETVGLLEDIHSLFPVFLYPIFFFLSFLSLCYLLFAICCLLFAVCSFSSPLTCVSYALAAESHKYPCTIAAGFVLFLPSKTLLTSSFIFFPQHQQTFSQLPLIMARRRRITVCGTGSLIREPKVADTPLPRTVLPFGPTIPVPWTFIRLGMVPRPAVR